MFYVKSETRSPVPFRLKSNENVKNFDKKKKSIKKCLNLEGTKAAGEAKPSHACSLPD